MIEHYGSVHNEWLPAHLCIARRPGVSCGTAESVEPRYDLNPIAWFLPMAVYVYSEEQIERMLAQSRRMRIGLCLAACVILPITGVIAFYRPDLPIFHEPLRDWTIAIVTSLFLLPLVNNLRRWRSWPARMQSSLRKTSVEIASGVISVTAANGGKRQIRTSELLRADEPLLGRGLYLRSSNRYRWILIPRKLDGYEAIKREIGLAGTTIVKTSIPPNPEEFLFVVLFCGTMICALAVHNIYLLKVNFVVSLLLGFFGFYVINSNPETLALPRMRWAKFGAFLPVVAAAWGIWSALHGW